MAERWIGVVICVSRYVRDDQPGIIECELCDAYGHLWTFIDKQSAVGRSDLDAETVYPKRDTSYARLSAEPKTRPNATL